MLDFFVMSRAEDREAVEKRKDNLVAALRGEMVGQGLLCGADGS